MNENTTSISELNMDCLLEICTYLPYFDQINFMEVCPSLQMSQDYLFKKYKTLDLCAWYDNEEMPTPSVKDFEEMYKVLQNYVKDLHIRGDNCPGKIHLTMASKYLKNLKGLYLYNLDFESIELEEFKNVKTFHATNCTLSPNFFSKVSNATEIKLIDPTDFISGLNLLKKLETMDIRYWGNFHTKLLTKCVENNPQLKHIVLHPAHMLDFNSFNELLTKITSLKFLTYLGIGSRIHSLFETIQFQEMESLTFLIVELKKVSPTIYRLLERNQLKFLDIAEWQSNDFDTSKLERHLLNCTNLKYLVLNPVCFDVEYLLKLKKKLKLISIDSIDTIYNDCEFLFEPLKLNEHLQSFDSPFIVKNLANNMNFYANRFYKQEMDWILISPDILNSFKLTKNKEGYL